MSETRKRARGRDAWEANFLLTRIFRSNDYPQEKQEQKLTLQGFILSCHFFLTRKFIIAFCFLHQVLKNMTSTDFGESLRQKIYDNRTFVN